ncbi:hypothetical protein FISHEDRAFT_58557, partial [Fistulina hepatica ATCC 64428]
MLYRPLFWTSYWCEDYLFSSLHLSGATAVVISSASSKTAFLLAYRIRKRSLRSVKVFGLTSEKNREFVRKLGLYDEVLVYDTFAFSLLFPARKTDTVIYVDVAGNAALNQRVFAQFASPYAGSLSLCLSLGMTTLSPSDRVGSEWGLREASTAKPSQPMSPFWPIMESFFMPEWLAVRRKQLPQKVIVDQQNAAWTDLIADCQGWVRIKRMSGANAVLSAYVEMSSGQTDAQTGFVC